jgi:RNA polymerase sigma-70 factor (sigma-E family)
MTAHSQPAAAGAQPISEPEPAAEPRHAAEPAEPAWARSAAEGIDAVYREHAIGLTRFALMLVGDQSTAEDVVQEAFLALYRGWHRLREPGNVVGYLRTAVLNGCRSVQRSRGRARLRRVPHDPPVWSAEAAAMEGEDRRAMLAAVARLPQRQREVLALRYYLELGEHETAAILGVSRGTVSSTAVRALRALAHQMREDAQ